MKIKMSKEKETRLYNRLHLLQTKGGSLNEIEIWYIEYLKQLLENNH